MEKATELGVKEIHPILMERSVKTSINIDRCNKILISAAKQCRRSFFPILHKPKDLHTLLNTNEGCKYYSCDLNADLTLFSYKSTLKHPSNVIIGPEGGFSKTEIDLMKGAAIISQQAMKVAMETINPGVRQCDAVAEIQRALFRGTPEIGGEYASIATLLPTGKGTSASHLTATDKKFVNGEATIIELSGVNKRYHSPMARTVQLGKPEQKKIDAMKATNEALDAGISATKPGNTADDVAQKFWGVLDKYNIKKESRTGYSIGIGYPPDWGEHTLNIYKGDMTLLEPNICFHMIAVMQFGDWGVEASEAIRVTNTGAELFCNLSKELHVKS